MQRSILFLALACVAALFLPACGDGAGGGIEGTWVIDKSHFEGEVMKGFEAELDKIPEAAREMAAKQMEQQRAAMKKAVAESDFAVVIKQDGTWTSSGAMMGDRKTDGGTWKLDGDKVTITTTSEDGKEDKHGTFTGSAIEIDISEGPRKATMRLLRK